MENRFKRNYVETALVASKVPKALVLLFLKSSKTVFNCFVNLHAFSKLYTTGLNEELNVIFFCTIDC